MNSLPSSTFQIGPASVPRLNAVLISEGEGRIQTSTCRSMHYHSRPNADVNPIITRQTWWTMETNPDYWVACHLDRQIVYSSIGIHFQTLQRRLNNDICSLEVSSWETLPVRGIQHRSIKEINETPVELTVDHLLPSLPRIIKISQPRTTQTTCCLLP